MRHIIRSVEAEYTRYKALAEGAMAQLEDADVNERGPNAGNSIAMIVGTSPGTSRPALRTSSPRTARSRGDTGRKNSPLESSRVTS